MEQLHLHTLRCEQVCNGLRLRGRKCAGAGSQTNDCHVSHLVTNDFCESALVWVIPSGRTRFAGPDLVGPVSLSWFVSRWEHSGAPDPSVSTVRSVAGVDFAAGPVRVLRCRSSRYCTGVWFFCLCCRVVPCGVAGSWGADMFATGVPWRWVGAVPQVVTFQSAT